MKIKSIGKFISGVIRNFTFPIQSISGNISSAASIYDSKFTDDEGQSIDLSIYKGKKLMIVNTASQCRYTKQYFDLEVLSNDCIDKLNIIAFPCNDFGKQEKGSNSEIQEFCKVNYGVSFKVFRKTDVNETSEQQVFNWLCNANRNGWNDQIPMWNFWKFLLNEEGKLVAIFPSRVSPLSKKVINYIDS